MTENKLCWHWTAGTNNPCKTDIEAYHYLVDSKGKIYLGKYPPEANYNCYDGEYAKHCGGGNTHCIGVAACGMAGFSFPAKKTKYPLTREQIEAMWGLSGYLSIKYNVPILPLKMFTHAEFDKRKPQKQQEGKIDITFLPYSPQFPSVKIGDEFRSKTKWYKEQFLKGKKKLVKKGAYYEII